MIELLLAAFLTVQSPQCAHFKEVMPQVATVFSKTLGVFAGEEARLILKILLNVERPIEVLVFVQDPSDGEVAAIGFRGDGCRDGWQNALTKEQVDAAIKKSQNGA